MNMYPSTITTEIPPVQSGRGRILLVDDEPVLRSMASTMLTMQGWEVLSASSAEEAAKLLRYAITHQTRVMAVIMDLIMPGGMSGIEALQALRSLQPDLRIIASSGFLIGEESRTACVEMGFDDMLPKPYSMDELCRIVERNAVASQTAAAF
jgi:two-component system cell cycle sensor histidine kinase/response regulator CckA